MCALCACGIQNYDMISIYLLTVIGLTPGGSSNIVCVQMYTHLHTNSIITSAHLACPYPEPDQSSPISLKIHFNIIVPSTPRYSK